MPRRPRPGGGRGEPHDAVAPPRGHLDGRVAVVTAGTSDIPVADEAALALRAYGFEPTVVTDVGVAGLHRLLARLDDLTEADALIVVAGMEGALASVLGGLTGAPVVAVPTSVGYGAGLDGVTALLAMHASCASGVTVVGIDNGFGAACAIARMLLADPMTTSEGERRVAWFNCQAGVAGDMTMARWSTPAPIPMSSHRRRRARRRRLRPDVREGPAMRRAGLLGERRRVHHHDETRPRTTITHRPLSATILALLDGADLPERVRERARAVFAGSPRSRERSTASTPTDVELHEVGALDSIVDVVGVCAALEASASTRCGRSPIAVGHGTVRQRPRRHAEPGAGDQPHCSPRRSVPTVGLDTTMEVSTPTGVALMTTLATGSAPCRR